MRATSGRKASAARMSSSPSVWTTCTVLMAVLPGTWPARRSKVARKSEGSHACTLSEWPASAAARRATASPAWPCPMRMALSDIVPGPT
ncbi:hypothetical protein [Tessaracoccus defluvii]|uniref:Uncharacterized protein n=1 Tax=Tessaracoccus defluvii TaxID=1285901 RepID=A0A7H0H2Q0_9ACTN|nr:hypothetical protein [Tessaracoccus defluvii]QNP54816.1 hypothetical protein H9L22_10940 [Tessaracoccus defluvii]